MKTVGIISEFNPFHNGHKYLIETVKKELQADCVVAVMSGNFTQRGAPAVFDMHTRAKIACENGVDLVLEIPPQFVLNSAEFYAYYGVYILHQLKGIDYIAFGSECGDISELQKVASKTPENVKEKMKNGITYAKAVATSPILAEPNNILAVEYLRAIKKLHSTIQPYTIKRISVEHNSKTPVGNYASASYIRESIRNDVDVSKYVPDLPKEIPVFDDCFIDLLNYRIIHSIPEDVSLIQNISEGLENRIISNRGKENVREMIESMKCKRYPETRIRRALYCLLLDIQKSNDKPSYTRVLAFSPTGQKFLKEVKKETEFPIYSRLTKKDILENYQLKKELVCNEIYYLGKRRF